MKKVSLFLLALIFSLSLYGCFADKPETESKNDFIKTVADAPDFYGMAYVEINNNIPEFSKEEITQDSYENYSALDYLGRCGVASACVGLDIMPEEERGEIGMIKPTGWHTVKYDVVDGKYLYNRCHLIGFQLTGENANEQNLITGTRFLNIEGMLPFENMVADYIKETGNHVMYRVTPFYQGINLICKGVQIEGYSVEDDGDGISFNIFAYNAQPQIEINYLTGESRLINTMLPSGTNSEFSSNNSKHTQSYSETKSESMELNLEKDIKYIANKNSKKIHLDSCLHIKNMKEENREECKGEIDEYLNMGYTLCKTCLED